MRRYNIKPLSYAAIAATILFSPSALARDDVGGSADSTISVEAQPLADALKEFSDQTGLQIAYVATLAENKTTDGVENAATPVDALDAILDSTGLEYQFVNDETVAIGVADEGGDSEAGNGRTAGATRKPVMMAQASAEQSQTSRRIETDSDKDEIKRTLEEIIVTGTNIRGIAPVGAQPFVIDRDTIDKLGVGTAQEIVRTLPQNFNGGVGGEDRRVLGRGPINAAAGAGVNLRGLGGDSTLVLVNGRRMPQGASPNGQFVDVSSIPLGAIERVEVLADGASALYGSDAIAGVVNFVLRKDYEGAETRLRYGTVTNGSLDEYQASQVFGANFGRANVLIGYEYFHKNPLLAEEREYAADGDLSRFGGPNAGSSHSNPANIEQVTFSDGSTQSVTFAIPEGQDGTNLLPGDLLEGVVNLRNVNEGRWLLAKQDRHSAFLTATYEPAPKSEFYGEFRFTNRAFEVHQAGETISNIIVPDSNPFFVTPVAGATAVRIDYNMIDDLGPRTDIGNVETIVGVLGFSTSLGDDWQFDAYSAYSEETTDATANVVHRDRLNEALGFDDPATAFDPDVDGYLNPFADGSNTDAAVLNYIQGFGDRTQKVDLWTARGVLDGNLFSLPGGDLRVAIGGEYRDEGRRVMRLDFSEGLEPQAIDPEILGRSVVAAFGELYIPVFGEGNARPGLEELLISVAARYEDYSDFGSSLDPKVGVTWSPVNGLTFRGTYGTSFKAPLLTDIGQTYFVDIFPLPNPSSPTGTTVSAILQGENPNLVEETSTAWTTGIDIQPVSFPGFRFQGTYFSMEFEDQVGRIPGSLLFALSDPNFSSVTTFDPDPALVQSLIDGAASFFDFSNGEPVVALVDGRISNLAITEVSGLDIGLQYDLETRHGDFNLALNATYLIDFKRAISTSSPLTEHVDTLNNPIDLKLRGSAGWSLDRFSANLFVNYADDYTNDSLDPAQKIDAWKTVDLSLRYDLERAGADLFTGASISLNVQNLFDEDPPLAIDGALNVGLAYDSENADPLGRLISAQLTKRW